MSDGNPALTSKTANTRTNTCLKPPACGVAFHDYVNGSTRLEGFPAGQEPISRPFMNNRDGTFTDAQSRRRAFRRGQAVCIGSPKRLCLTSHASSTCGVAGFRLDAVDSLFEDPNLTDNPFADGTDTFGRRNMDEKYNQKLPEVHGVLRGLRKVADEYNAVLIGETYTSSIDELKRSRCITVIAAANCRCPGT